MEPALDLADIPNDMPLQKADFAFPSSYQLQTTSWIGRDSVLLLFSVLGFYKVLTSADRVCCHTVCSLVMCVGTVVV